jgi:hypothetical protein
MTVSEFISKYTGKYLEVVDSTNKYQCFDLAVGYCNEVLGLPTTIFSGLTYAYQIYTNPTTLAKNNFTFIANEADNKPNKGDIVVWSYYYNWTAGHVGVATGEGESTGTSNDWFNCFEQNDPTGAVCQTKKYSFNNVLGWLRFKKTTPNADTYVYAAKDAITSARNSVNTGSQVGDPDFKTKMSVVKQKAQEIINIIG